MIKTVSNTVACDYRQKACVCGLWSEAQKPPALPTKSYVGNKTKIFNMNVLPMVNQVVPDFSFFNAQMTYSQKMYQAFMTSASWWSQLNAYSAAFFGAKMGAQPGQTVGLLSTVKLPFSDGTMTEFYLQVWIRDLVSQNKLVLRHPNSGSSSQEVKNVLAIHTNVNVVNYASQTTCVNICAFHSSVDVSDITKVPGQSVLYMVIPFMKNPDVFGIIGGGPGGVCKACAHNADFSLFKNDLSMTASHELQEVVILESLGDLQDETKKEVADLCSVLSMLLYISII
jgi:hypothetical protein